MNSADRETSAGPAASVDIDVLAAQDDPRVASALAAYLAAFESGARPSREGWLEQHPEIAGTLGDWFDVIELVHDAARPGSAQRSHVPSDDCLPAETVLGEYRLVREIARGGMAIVYEAEQVLLRRRVALKVLSGSAALDRLKLERFRVETQAVAQLNHPHIVPIFAVGSERGSHFYAMQYIDGPTLAEVIRQLRAGGEFSPNEARGSPGRSATRTIGANSNSDGGGLLVKEFGGEEPELSSPGLGASRTGPFRGRRASRAFAKLAVQAAEALAHAHAMGILHRDVKPSNLLIDSRGNLWVADFGLARLLDEPGLTRTGDLLGTLRYMAPELVLGHRIAHDPRSDVYSLGATFYELLTTRPVFDGRNRQELLRQIAQEEPTAPRKLDPTIPRDVETIVLKAMDKVPERRYTTAQQLADDLRRFLEDKPIFARRATSAERAAKWARRHRAVLEPTVAVAFLALAIAAPSLWWQQSQTAQANRDLQLTFERADLGFQEMIRLSDELTMKGMTRYAEAGGTPEARRIRADFFRQAIDFYEHLVNQPHISRPMRALAYHRLARSRMMGPQDLRAEEDFAHSIKLYRELLADSPRDPGVRRAIADVQVDLGMQMLFTRGLHAAEAIFRQLKSIDEGLLADFPADPDSLGRLTEHRIQIVALLESTDTRTAADRELRELLAVYERAAADASASPDGARLHAAAYHRLARALEQVRRFPEAQDALRRARKLGGDDPELQGELARLLVMNADAAPREAEEAIALAKQSAAANPKEPACWNTLALAYLRAGQLLLAAQAVEKSLALRSSEGDGSEQFVMAIISWRRGEREAALEWYIQAVDRFSSNPLAGPTMLSLRAEADRVLGRSKR
jgi:serine/threonine protein kinase/Flp pilus assembly protein TadD